MRRKGQRALGPYPHRDGWRAIRCEADGSRTRIRFATREECEAFVDEFNLASAVAGITVGEALDRYEVAYLASGKKASSIAETRRRIVRILGNLDADLDAITPRKAQAAYDKITGEMAVDSHRGILTHVKTFFSFCVAKRFIPSNPFGEVKPVGMKKDRRAQHLRRNEARAFAAGVFKLLSECQERIQFERYLMGLTALYLGTRASELTLRQVRDIDDDCTLYVIPGGKTWNAMRTERIPDELQPFYRRLVDGRPGEAPLFPGRYGRHHDHRYVTRYCVRPLCEALGLPDATAHALRRTFANLALEGGTAPLVVASELGQGSFAVTKAKYASPQAIADGQARKAQTVLRVVR